MSKPIFVSINVKDDVLYGVDQSGDGWFIKWVGNGQYSHWALISEADHDVMYYVYRRAKEESAFVEQIE